MVPAGNKAKCLSSVNHTTKQFIIIINKFSVLTYIETTQEELEKWKIKNRNHLTTWPKGERIALQKLSQRYDIALTKADKGSVVVIIDVEGKIREAESQLKKKDYHNRLKHDPKETLNRHHRKI